MSEAAKPHSAAERRPILKDKIDENSDESFPASDAPSWTPVARVGRPRPDDKQRDDIADRRSA